MVIIHFNMRGRCKVPTSTRQLIPRMRRLGFESVIWNFRARGDDGHRGGVWHDSIDARGDAGDDAGSEQRPFGGSDAGGVSARVRSGID
jgi:hypothetical protein